MTNAEAVKKPRRLLSKVGRFLFVASISVLVLYSVARLVWRFSGSNEWEVVRQGNGATVYALKEPGADLIQYRGVVRVNSTLNRFVAWLQDPDTCRDSRCHEPRMIERVDDQLQYVSMRMNMPGPLRKREFVMRARFHQIPATKELWVEYAAAPEKAPPNDCCFRVTDMNNTWRLTPLGNGQIEAEYTMNMEWGGFLPDLLSNKIRARYMFVQLQRLEAWVNREEYQSARYDFIHEDVPAAAVAAAPATVVNQ